MSTMRSPITLITFLIVSCVVSHLNAEEDDGESSTDFDPITTNQLETSTSTIDGNNVTEREFVNSNTESDRSLLAKANIEYVALSPFDCINFKSDPLLLMDALTLHVPHVYTKSSRVRFWLSTTGGAAAREFAWSGRMAPESGQSVYLRLNESCANARDSRRPYYTITVTYDIIDDDGTVITSNNCSQAIECRGDLRAAASTPDRDASGKRRFVVRRCEKRTDESDCPGDGPAMRIVEVNATHFDSESLDLDGVAIAYVVDDARCTPEQFPLAFCNADFHYATNGSLLLPTGFVSPRGYCQLNNATMAICTDKEHTASMAVPLYVLTGTSMVSLLGVIVYYSSRRRCKCLKDTFVWWLAIALFLQQAFMLASRFFNGHWCIVLGNMYQFFEIMGFITLVVIVREYAIFFRNPGADRRTKEDGERRFMIYSKVIVVLTVIVGIVLMCSQFHPNLPQYIIHKECNIPPASIRTLLYQLPVAVCIVLSMAYLLGCYRSYKKRVANIFARKQKRPRKQMITVAIIWGSMTGSWIVQIISFYLPHIINSSLLFVHLEGSLIFIVTVYYEDLCQKAIRKIRKEKDSESAIKPVQNVRYSDLLQR